jgi:hypothetical protein
MDGGMNGWRNGCLRLRICMLSGSSDYDWHWH